MLKHGDSGRGDREEPHGEDASAENRELGGVLRKLGEFLRRDAQIDWPEDREWCADVLRRVAADCEKSLSLRDLLAGCETETGGSEHEIIKVLSEPTRIFKVTFGDNLGCRSEFYRADPELTGKHYHATGNADPMFYLQRWMLLNSISDYQTRYEGILPPARKGQLPRICVSQPFVSRACDPSELEIEQALSMFGYWKISEDAFLNEDSGILLTDAAPRNLGVESGNPTLFDAIAEIAPQRVVEWAAITRRA
jgi:hypothetical protein